MDEHSMIQLLLLFSSLVPTLQHGYLLWPPNRSSLWRYGYNTTKNYNDNALYCGGRMLLEESNGKCGVCGDPYIGPRKHEAGGLYASGIIAAKYPLDTKTITVTVLLTVNHQGYFEFRLCPHNEPTVPVTQRCLDKFLLPIQEGSIKHRKMRFYPKEELGHAYNLSLDIPRGMICTQCVLQWRYHTENSWGFDPNGTSCIGCGLQEEFYNCADISIGEDEHASKNKYDNPYSIERTLEQNGMDITNRTLKQNTTELTVEKTTVGYVGRNQSSRNHLSNYTNQLAEPARNLLKRMKDILLSFGNDVHGQSLVLKSLEQIALSKNKVYFTSNSENTVISASNLENTVISSSNPENTVISASNPENTVISVSNPEKSVMSASNPENTVISSSNHELSPNTVISSRHLLPVSKLNVSNNSYGNMSNISILSKQKNQSIISDRKELSSSVQTRDGTLKRVTLTPQSNLKAKIRTNKHSSHKHTINNNRQTATLWGRVPDSVGSNRHSTTTFPFSSPTESSILSMLEISHSSESPTYTVTSPTTPSKDRPTVSKVKPMISLLSATRSAPHQRMSLPSVSQPTQPFLSAPVPMSQLNSPSHLTAPSLKSDRDQMISSSAVTNTKHMASGSTLVEEITPRLQSHNIQTIVPIANDFIRSRTFVLKKGTGDKNNGRMSPVRRKYIIVRRVSKGGRLPKEIHELLNSSGYMIRRRKVRVPKNVIRNLQSQDLMKQLQKQLPDLKNIHEFVQK